MIKKEGVKQTLTDVEVLQTIQQLQWTTTSQLVSYIGFYNRRRMLRKLEQLNPYLHIIQEPSRHIYGLNAKGGALLGTSPVTLLTDVQDIYDVLFRNEVWEWCGYPDWQWQTELFPSRKREPLTPSAYWHQGKRLHVVEIDTGENLRQILQNMRRYEGLVRQAETRGTPVPQVYYFTNDRIRLAWLEEALGGHQPWLRCVYDLKKGR